MTNKRTYLGAVKRGLQPWEVAFNRTKQRWMIWRDGSPAIAECVLESDADRICALLNREGIQ